jgi:tetratricopeptide (TPR) repeat protein
MNRRTIPFGLMFFSLFYAIAVPAQTAKPAATHSGHQAADSAARTQLAAYLADFQNKPDDTTLRSEIVALAKTMNPAPPIPQQARDNFANAGAKLKAAATAEDLKAAARLFEQVSVQAPWYADADYNAAAAFAQANDFDDARRNLALYMAAVRTGVNTQSAEALGHDIDRQQSDQQFQSALPQFVGNPNDAARRQIIKLAQSLKTPPEIPEEARGHYVMAMVLVNTAEDNPGYEQRAIEEFKAALLAAPWWGEVYKKLATVQASAGKYDDAIASLNLYELTEPSDARDAQDEVYRLKALQRVAADEEAKKQAKDQQRRALAEKQLEDRAASQAGGYTVAGRWYDNPTPDNYFVGGQSKPECDYSVSQSAGRWVITNSCARPTWGIDQIQVRAGEISFHLSGHDPGYPFTLVIVTLALSDDGKSLGGQEAVYLNGTEHIGDHPVRWSRRE